MKKFLFAVMISFAFSSTALAAGYGEAGCGLGSLIFGDTNGAVQIIAATTNGSSGSQTFGISSGTSNCDTSGFDMSQLNQEQFVASNFSGLAKEAAIGEGEHLEALAGMMGCPTDKQPLFNSTTHQDYPVIFASDSITPSEALAGIKTAVLKNAELSSACSVN
jgi:Protein of unknown function (DUF3015)